MRGLSDVHERNRDSDNARAAFTKSTPASCTVTLVICSFPEISTFPGLVIASARDGLIQFFLANKRNTLRGKGLYAFWLKPKFGDEEPAERSAGPEQRRRIIGARKTAGWGKGGNRSDGE